MAVNLSPLGGAGWQFFDNNGIPLSGGLLYTYAAGTSTPLATYTSISGNIANSNPIVLDAAGRVPNEIWITTGYGYKFVLQTATSVSIATWDNIPSNAPSPFANDASSIAYEEGYTVTAGNFIVGLSYQILSIGTTNFVAIGAASNTVGVYFTATGVGSGTGTAKLSRTVQAKLQEQVSVLDFGAKGDGVTDDTAAIQAAIDSIPLSGGGTSHGYSLFFPPGKYLISAPLVIGNRRLTILGVPLVTGSGSSSIIYCPTAITRMIDVTTGNADVFSIQGIEFLGNNINTVSAMTLGSVAQTLYDSRVNNCWFSLVGGTCIELKYAGDIVITDCGFDSGSQIGINISNPPSDNNAVNTISNNIFFGQSVGGIYISKGSGNNISGNIFYLCGSQTTDSEAAIVINGTSPAIRATLISSNVFYANGNDIAIFGNSGTYSANTGVIETQISSNVSNQAYRHFIYATDASYTQCSSNKVGICNQINASLPAIVFVGNSDNNYITANQVSYVGGITGPTYGLSLGSSTTNTIIGENNFQGSVAPIQYNSGCTYSSSLSQTGTWTPTIGGTATYTIQEGYYVKVGALVYLQGKLVINAIGTGSTTTISGLPFPVFNATYASNGGGSVTYFSGLAISVVNIVPTPINNSSTMQFDVLTAAATSITAGSAVMTSGTRFDFNVVYRANA